MKLEQISVQFFSSEFPPVLSGLRRIQVHTYVVCSDSVDVTVNTCVLICGLMIKVAPQPLVPVYLH